MLKEYNNIFKVIYIYVLLSWLIGKIVYYFNPIFISDILYVGIKFILLFKVIFHIEKNNLYSIKINLDFNIKLFLLFIATELLVILLFYLVDNKFILSNNGGLLRLDFITPLILAPYFEELFFRKYLFDSLENKTFFQNKKTILIIIISVVFSILHDLTLAGFINRFLASCFYTYSYSKTKNIAVPIFYHFLSNLIVYISCIVGFVIE